MIQLDEGVKLARDAVQELQEDLGITEWFIGGSLAVCNEGNDVDVVILASRDCLQAMDALAAHGFEPCNTEYAACRSWKRGPVNFIVEHDAYGYSGWVRSAQICTLIHATNRDVRVAVHMIVRDGECLYPVLK